MPASQVEKNRFRTRLSGTINSMTDAYLDDDVFAEAEARYAGYSRDAVFAAALVRGVEDLMMRASSQVDYTEGDASEKLSQRMKHLELMLTRFKAQLAEEMADDDQWAGWLPFNGVTTYREEPNS